MAVLLVTGEQMRSLDRCTIEEFNVPSFTLMQRAATGAVKVLRQRFSPRQRRRVLIVAGKGNNGGDGMVCARLLAGKGTSVTAALIARAEDLRGDAARAFRGLRGTGVSIITEAGPNQLPSLLSEATLVVDALLGTGLNAPVTGVLAEVITALNSSGKPILSLDIPSGLDSDSGAPRGVAVQATVTATFGFPKIGQVVYPGRAFVGELEVIDIGIPEVAAENVAPRAWLIEPVDVARRLPVRAPTTHKGNCGHVVVIGGSLGRTGAAKMAAEAALRAGAGLVTLAGPASLSASWASACPEIMTAPLPDHSGNLSFDEAALHRTLEGKDVVVVGPGMGTSEACLRVLQFVLERSDLPVVCDADALTLLARFPVAQVARRPNLVLTPHPGEFARLTGKSVAEIQSNRPIVARDFAMEQRCVLVLKGATTIIADGDGTLWVNPTGNPGMASGGMGDVLAGLIGGFLAQGLSGVSASLVAVYVHGAAADTLCREYAAVGYLATEVARQVPREVNALRG